MIEILPPTKFEHNEFGPNTLFLSGSIEMGKAIDWQASVVDHLKDVDGYVFNPRRRDWDSSWVQSIHNKQFNEQVTWELDNMESCDRILINFLEDSKSPITLLELGIVSSFSAWSTQPVIVFCPPNFWRKGNVDIVCKRFDIPVYDRFDLDLIKDWING